MDSSLSMWQSCSLLSTRKQCMWFHTDHHSSNDACVIPRPAVAAGHAGATLKVNKPPTKRRKVVRCHRCA